MVRYFFYLMLLIQRMNGRCSPIWICLQVPHKSRLSTPQVKDELHTSNPYILELIKVIGDKDMSVKEMLTAIGLKERKNFLNLYLKPAIGDGYVCLLYPNSPRHPRQKYLLTVKGLTVYDECVKSM